MWTWERTLGWENRKAINAVFDQRLLPAAAWVESFCKRQGRLPTDVEMRAYSMKNFAGNGVRIMREPPPWGVEWENGWVMGKDFVLCDGIPDWNLYYRSRDQRKVEAWTD
jgi:hypothetical protein